LDWSIFHAVNEFAGDERWLAHAVYAFERFGVVLYVLAVALLWLASRPGTDRRWKLAALAGTASAGLALLINQAIGKVVWHRPRPYDSHAGVYHLSNSHDASFPSDHASAAFAIALGIYLVDRRVGRLFVAVAAAIAAGRVLIGAHYPGDVLAGLGVGLAAALIVVRLGGPLLVRAVRVLERISDPVVAPLHERLGRSSAAG
jgi:membrane-associated phospholipid phosphatase